MHSVLFTIFGLDVHAYGFMIDLGIIGAYILLYCTCNRYRGINKDNVIDIVILISVAGMLGSRILYVILYRSEFPDLKSMLAIWNGGQAFHGGLILGIVCLAVYCRLKKLELMVVLDMLAPALCLAYGFGRIGCFLNGCCYGMVSDLPIACPMPTENGIENCIPTQLISSAAGFIMCILLTCLYKRFSKDGLQFFTFIAMYGVYRFMVEFLRFYPDDGHILTIGQYLSLFMILAGITASVYIKKKA